MKKIVSLLVTLSLLVGMALTPVYAQAAGSKGSGGGQPQAQGNRTDGDTQPGKPPADKGKQNNDSNGQGGGQNKPSDQNNGKGADQNNGLKMGQVDVSALEAAIATVEDSDTAASLTALLNTYKTAAAGDDQEAAQTALQTLLRAMRTANVQTQAQAGKPDDKGPAPVDADAIASAIAGLTDTDAAASLTELLTAYQTAAEGDDRAATQSALQALLSAMETAGLDTSAYETPVQKVAALLDTDRVSAAINTMTDTDTAASLTALLTAYQTAVEGGDATAIKTALEALKDGLKDAGLMQSYDRASEQGQAMRTLGERYGRFLDVARIEAAIENLSDSLTAANLSALLAAYQEAAAGSDEAATRAALDALLAAMKEANLQMDRIQEEEDRLNLDDGSYLDTDKVAIAISTLEDTDVAATLTALLSAYETALDSGDRDATMTAYNALLDGMETAGLQM